MPYTVTTMTIDPPAAPPMSDPQAAESPEDQAHILVVDDDRRLRDLLQRYLSENGFRVTTASDAATARAKLGSLAFDLIVLDVMMPGESGLDFTTSLRKTDTVPILLLTAMGEAEDRIRGFERGADDYLPKPFEPRELVLRIRTILHRLRQPPAAPPPAAPPPPPCPPALASMTRIGISCPTKISALRLLRIVMLGSDCTSASDEVCSAFRNAVS